MKKTFLAPAALSGLLLSFSPAFADPGTAFTYQGLLTVNGSPANGNYDLTFAIFDADPGGTQVGATITNSPTVISNGLFTVTLDFRAGVFTGPRRWLEIASQPTGGGGSFVTAGPRQELTPAPYAIYAASAGTATGVAASAVSAPQLNTTGGPSPGQVLSYDGTSLAWTTAGSSGSSSNAWLLGGNGGTTSANFLGTSDNRPLEMRVNNQRALRVELSTFNGSNAPSLIGGAVGNFVAFPSVGATISGGGALGYMADPQSGDPGANYTNSVTGDFGTVGGGSKNASAFYGTVGGGEGNSSSQSYATVGGGSGNHSTGSSATVGGGAANTSSGNSATVAGGAANTSSGNNATIGGGFGNKSFGPDSTTVGGGYLNVASNYAATVAGGQNNTAWGLHAAVGGGYFNTANRENATVGGGSNNLAGGFGCTVSGGLHNTASGRGPMSFFESPATVGGGEDNNASGNYSTIPGGARNTATGWGSFAAGVDAHANDDGSFVWSDGTISAISLGANTFNAVASGGFNLCAGGGCVTIAPDGTLACKVLTIRGADVAEPFEISTRDLPKGSVVIIDEDNPGQLKLSDRAYDQRVAGILSGANGVRAGICLSQPGFNEGGQNVALSGRVYVLADASSSPIKPGDLLTSSETPGHAMKAADYTKAQGAILGKAMSTLEEGKGMVLVLVTLQ